MGGREAGGTKIGGKNLQQSRPPAATLATPRKLRGNFTKEVQSEGEKGK